MPKAVYSAPSGASVTVEGTHDEVVAVLGFLESQALNSADPRPQPRSGKATPMGLLGQMIDRGFFSEPKALSAVKGALEEEGQFYPTTTLSPLMLRLVRKRELRRLRERNRWMYVR